MTKESESKGRVNDGLDNMITALNNMINAHNLSTFEKQIVLVALLELNSDLKENLLGHVNTQGTPDDQKIVNDRIDKQ